MIKNDEADKKLRELAEQALYEEANMPESGEKAEMFRAKAQ